MKKKIALLAATALLASCKTVSEPTRVAQVEDWRPSNHVVQTTSLATEASPEQMATICETDDMRRNVIDDIDSNDTVRVMAFQDGDVGSRVISETEIDCKTYFLRKSLAPSSARLVRTSAPTVQRIETERRIIPARAQSYTYIVQKGDTVWGIAREYCTDAYTISRLNGLGAGNLIDIGQRLQLPDDACH